MTHVHMVEDQKGDLVDIEYYCSQWCHDAARPDESEPSAYPCPDWPDYSVYCGHCLALLHEGVES